MQRQVKTIDPNRVRVARESVGFTKAQLANLLQVAVRTVSNYEDEGAPGRRAPALAKSTGRPLQFFSDSPLEVIEPESAYFRATKKVSKRAKSEITATGSIGMEFYEHFVEPYQLPPIDLPTFDNLDPQVAAGQVRVSWCLGDEPLPNLVQLFESKGIRIMSLPGAAEKLDAFSHWYGDGQPYIFLKTSKTAERIRFDLAHELGHLVLHSRGSQGAGRDLEKEADRFAAEFLLPARAVRAELPPRSGLDEIFALKRKFRVSAMAVNYRGGELGLLTDWAQRQNYVSLSTRGFRTGEPDGFLPDRSRIIPHIVADMRAKGKSITALASAVGVTMREVHDFTFGEVLVAVKTGAGVDRGELEHRKPQLRLV